MKLLVICALLPVFVLAQTTEWSSEDSSYTLSPSPMVDSTSSTGKPRTGRTAKVELELSGPSSSNSSSFEEKQTTTTEDTLLPLLLRKILEDSLNEIDPERNSPSQKEQKQPLAYMTPPPPLPNMDKQSPIKGDEASDEDIDISTPAIEDPNPAGTDSNENNTENSAETPTNTVDSQMPFEIRQKIDTGPKMGQNEKDSSSENVPQYAHKYQKYLPSQQISQNQEAEVDGPPTPENENSQEPESIEENPENQPVPVSPTPQVSGMDKMIFNDVPQSEQLSEHEEQNVDDNESSSPIGNQNQDHEQEPTPETPDDQDQDSPPPTIQPTRPIYYVFFRPKSQYRNPMLMDGTSEGFGMTPPKPYSPDQATWQMYPERLPLQKYQQFQQYQQDQSMQRQPQMISQTYNYPSQLASYSYQRPYYQNNPYLQQAIRNMMMQMPPTYYPSNYNQMQMYPGRQQMYAPQMQQQQGFGYNNYGNNGQQTWAPRPPMYTRPSYPSYPYYENYGYGANYNNPQMGYYERNMNDVAPRFFF